MLKKYFSLIISVLCVVAMLLNSQCRSCDDPSNPACDNYDPCYGKTPTSADFKMEERVGNTWFETDSVNGVYNLVRFTPIQQDAISYTWYLGGEVITDKSFSRTSFPQGKWVGITLVIQRNVDKSCYPNDRGIDTVYKRFFVWDRGTDLTGLFVRDTNPYPIYGTYKGSLASNPNRIFEVTLLDSIDYTNRYMKGIVRGIPFPDYKSDKVISPGTGDYVPFRIVSFTDGWSPKALSLKVPDEYGGWGGIPRTPPMRGFAWLDDNDTSHITVKYSMRDTLSTVWYPEEVFRGKRVK